MPDSASPYDNPAKVVSERTIRVFMIDDCRNDAAITLRTLRGAPHANYVMAIAESIESAIPLIKNEPCDVILLDLGMPGYEGLEALEEVRKADLNYPIVVLSGNESEKLAQLALKRGAQDYIVKGNASPEVMSRSIRYAIERHSLDQANTLASQSRGEFLRQLSHEVRTPMTSIQGFADLVANSTDGELQEAAQTIKKNGEALLAMLDELLEVARVDAEPAKLAVEPCDVRNTISVACEDLQSLAKRRDVLLHFEMSPTFPQLVEIDAARFEKLFRSLVGAAINTCDTGVLHVKIESQNVFEHALEVQITEAGTSVWRPLGAEKEVTINSTTFELTKRLAQAMQGSFTAKRNPPFSTIYSVIVPMKEVPQSKAEKPAAQQASNTKPTAIGDLKGCRVLVAEDAVDNQRLLKLILQSFGTQVEVVENGQLAVERLYNEGDFTDAESNNFDIVLMDMQMPVMDGYEATQTLRDRGYSGPIVAVTAHVLERERQKCFSAGCDDYLSKPVNPNLLKEKIAAHFSQPETSLA